MADADTYEIHQHAEEWLDNEMAKRMRYRMDKLGWTYADLQAETGIPAQTLRQYLAGGKVIPLLRYNEICFALCLCE